MLYIQLLTFTCTIHGCYWSTFFFSGELVPNFTFCSGGTTTITRDFIWNSLYIVVVRGLVCKFVSNHAWVFAKFLCVCGVFYSFDYFLRINTKFFCGIIATHAISLWGWLPPMLHPKNEKEWVCHTTALPFTLKNILMQNRNYENSNILPCKKYNLQKNHIKETKILQDIKTLWLILSFNTSQNIIFKKFSCKNRPTT